MHSKTPGHPEYGLTPGVETTTGPLGQGIAAAVGMALAERMLAAEFNREGHSIVDHFTYVFLGDGCLMEGVSHEACSLAGTLGLGKLIALWDDNGISIDGPTAGWFAEDVPARYKAYGWQVITGVDGHDPAAVKKALQKARKTVDKPSLICCRTTIGKGAPTKAGNAKCHGSPLGEEEVRAAKKLMGVKGEPFEVAADVRDEIRGIQPDQVPIQLPAQVGHDALTEQRDEIEAGCAGDRQHQYHDEDAQEHPIDVPAAVEAAVDHLLERDREAQRRRRRQRQRTQPGGEQARMLAHEGPQRAQRAQA